MISVLDPEALYIVKNTGTMVIGVSNHLHASEDQNIQTLDTSDNSDEATTEDHQFQIVASDTTVFQDYTSHYYNIEDKEILRVSIKDKI